MHSAIGSMVAVFASLMIMFAITAGLAMGSKDDGNDRRTVSLQRRLPTEGLQTSFSFRGSQQVITMEQRSF